jgi:hypothetical protein
MTTRQLPSSEFLRMCLLLFCFIFGATAREGIISERGVSAYPTSGTTATRQFARCASSSTRNCTRTTHTHTTARVAHASLYAVVFILPRDNQVSGSPHGVHSAT